MSDVPDLLGPALDKAAESGLSGPENFLRTLQERMKESDLSAWDGNIYILVPLYYEYDDQGYSGGSYEATYSAPSGELYFTKQEACDEATQRNANYWARMGDDPLERPSTYYQMHSAKPWENLAKELTEIWKKEHPGDERVFTAATESYWEYGIEGGIPWEKLSPESQRKIAEYLPELWSVHTISLTKPSSSRGLSDR